VLGWAPVRPGRRIALAIVFSVPVGLFPTAIPHTAHFPASARRAMPAHGLRRRPVSSGAGTGSFYHRGLARSPRGSARRARGRRFLPTKVRIL
jgi:hypothetical protein